MPLEYLLEGAGVDTTFEVGADVGLALYAQQSGEVADTEPQVLESYGPNATPDGQVGEQYPAEIPFCASVQVSSAVVAAGCKLG